MKKLFIIIGFIFANSIVLAQEIKYASGNHSWNEDSLGNHRAILQFNGTGKFAFVNIPWRRRDKNVAEKRIILQDAKTGQKILNVKVAKLNNEIGEIYFEPVSGKGNYYIYYMPYKNEGRSNYPKGVYLKPENTADASWLSSIPTALKANVVVKEIQSIDELNSFYPMEVIATAKETATLVANSRNKSYLVFPEDRLYSIRMKDRLPYRWTKTSSNTFTGQARKGENYSYQLGVYALQNLEDVQVLFSDLKTTNGAFITSKNISCINTHGTDYRGVAMTKKLGVARGQVQALWCLVDVPQNIAAGLYKGTATVKAAGKPATVINISLNISNQQLANGGIDEPWKQTRLKWLNSTLAEDDEVIAPYSALQLAGNTIGLLGRKLLLGKDGFPQQVQTYFTAEMTGYQQEANEVLASPVSFVAIDGNGSKLNWTNNGLHFTKTSNSIIQWNASNSNDVLQMDVEGSVEFDGFVTYKVKITALRDLSLNDIAMQIPISKTFSKYMMGLGEKGGNRPDRFDWKWQVATKNQDGAWLGNVNGGLQFSLRDEKYVRPLNTNFYLQKPLLLPASWGNDNKGGIKISDENHATLINNYSGQRSMKKGEALYYNFTLLITPFHPINTEFQWATKFFHKYANADTVKATGATVANIHHANAINPWINYPFIEYKKMKAYIDEAHNKGLKVKIYNTVRELSNHAYETFALRSLGHEIYSPGKGGGFSWLQEHMGDDYIAAWFVPEIKDAAIVNSGMSRWHNYYVEGMNWLVQNIGIDGIYLDDVAFDRVTMKRIKKVLTKDNHPGIIDLHSANQYNKSDGFNNSANLYMEHFPYLNRLWFGEYFDYEKNDPEFFLTEVSGIPFGLMGEMLQDGGNPWRGMIYGMTNRYPWSKGADPRPIWKLWNEFGMQGTEMIGYWSENCPVKTSNAKVLATVYKKNGAALISIASWAEEDVKVKLNIDWKKIGIDPSKATLVAQDIPNFQPAKTFEAGEEIPVQKNKGWLLIIK